MANGHPIRVLIVDDSAMFRRVLTRGLTQASDIKVVGAAQNAKEARHLIQKLQPDLITLDLDMPDEGGMSLLRDYMPREKIATIVISAMVERGVRRTIEALETGADEVLAKGDVLADDPSTWRSLQSIVRRVFIARRDRARGVRRASRALDHPEPALTGEFPEDWLIGIASSTGGVQALSVLLPLLPANAPGVVIVQHMPEGVTRAFADRVSSHCHIEVREARDGDKVQPGLALIAPGGRKHMVLAGSPGNHTVQLIEGAEVCYSRPSADVLFQSVARFAAPRCSAAILTGMGRDGAEGLGAIRRAGGRTFSQDRMSCSVYGMPKAAWEIGASEAQVPIFDMAAKLLGSVGTARASRLPSNTASAAPYHLKGLTK
ncbi:chemotaxis-specific protein-glutamate methyltransferase CheB [Pseudoprimorskyibacter insulae]|uniref:Protein-glutamate methylesterase/protein-glutamine glutaminase n=1 Tax=Pseudoprimorskyibacter insulae TaxID=1695997 RepID=A0A2R8AW00_9RHOB|nr:chemotaxis-specific protein-glutamate methyltransferase CheB [Pseudoprimorskyibacter insulae]SPF80074.1 Chemotaxis response regulator protein-glutamate methylesterase of group 2 operon [Pseudoprimorskyibacter insulae]